MNIKTISVTAELFISLNAPRTKTFSTSKRFPLLILRPRGNSRLFLFFEGAMFDARWNQDCQFPRIARFRSQCIPGIDFRPPVCDAAPLSLDSFQQERVMKDLKEQLEKLLTEAEDCELIGRLATDLNKRELFTKLATDLRNMARNIEALITTRAEINAGPRRPAAPPDSEAT